MPKSVLSTHSEMEEVDPAASTFLSLPATTVSSPTAPRRFRSPFFSNSSSQSQLNMQDEATEQTSLLRGNRRQRRISTSKSTSTTPGLRDLSRRQSSIHMSPTLSRTNSSRLRMLSSADVERLPDEGTTPSRTFGSIAESVDDEERVWYDQFTSTDWVHDSIADGLRVRELKKRKDFRGRLWLWFDSAQGWILMAIIGSLTALVAYMVDVAEHSIFDYKEGLCVQAWYLNRNKCCQGARECEGWHTWSQMTQVSDIEAKWVDYASFTGACVVLAVLSCGITLYSKTVVPSHTSLLTLDENLGAARKAPATNDKDVPQSPAVPPDHHDQVATTVTYYSAAGSGVAEVKVILSGFILHGFLGVKTLTIKTFALILSIASGLNLGKEGPYVHMATCIGNIACRMFTKYNSNDAKRREVLSAAAASGVTVAFGAPIGGVLFSLEEVSYYFPPKTLFRTFFCCIAAALCLKFLNPYGTGKIVLFEVRYVADWRFFEICAFIFLGVAGGLLGALFIKASRFWAQTFRQIPLIKKWPMLEVGVVALITGLISYWNRYTKLAVAELLFELASPCNPNSHTGLCRPRDEIPPVIGYLGIAFAIKALLTTITFGIKVPAGIYVPSMVVGGLMGRIVGHAIQYLVLTFPDSPFFASCPNTSEIEGCVVPGVYALIAAGATMCGVTRLSVTLAIILFELTGSLDHVLPFSLTVLCAKWTADAVEPLSIYDLLTDMNSYPFLDNKVHPVFDTTLADLIHHHPRKDHLIDVSASPLVPASDLREKLDHLQAAGELDTGLPLLRDGILIGILPAPDLEFALDRLANEDIALCLMVADSRTDMDEDELLALEDVEPVDFTRLIDPSPVALDVHSPMDLVYQCFVKLGLRYMCVLREARFEGLVHKKGFVRWVKEREEEERKRR